MKIEKKNEVETTNKKSKNNKTHYNDDEDIVIKKGSEIHRMVPKEWVEKENLKMDKDLKELLGHTPFEIIIGAILGCLIGGFFPI